MPDDERPTSQHVVQTANYSIRGDSKSLNQLTSSGKRAQDRREKDPKVDNGPAKTSNQGKSDSQESSKGEKKWRGGGESAGMEGGRGRWRS